MDPLALTFTVLLSTWLQVSSAGSYLSLLQQESIQLDFAARRKAIWEGASAAAAEVRLVLHHPTHKQSAMTTQVWHGPVRLLHCLMESYCVYCAHIVFLTSGLFSSGPHIRWPPLLLDTTNEVVLCAAHSCMLLCRLVV